MWRIADVPRQGRESRAHESIVGGIEMETRELVPMAASDENRGMLLEVTASLDWEELALAVEFRGQRE